MTTHANFTQNEWKLLSEAPMKVGVAIAAAAPSGLLGTIQEGMAIVTSIRNTARQYPQNSLIQDVLPKGVDADQARTWGQTALAMIQGSQAERLRSEGLDVCRRVGQLLDQKSPPQEAVDFKRWLLSIGESVARAAKEGGVEVSPPEKRALDEMGTALGMTRS